MGKVFLCSWQGSVLQSFECLARIGGGGAGLCICVEIYANKRAFLQQCAEGN